MFLVEPAGDDAMRLQALRPGRYRAAADPAQSRLAVLESMRLVRQEVSEDQAGPPIAENFERTRRSRFPWCALSASAGSRRCIKGAWRGADISYL